MPMCILIESGQELDGTWMVCGDLFDGHQRLRALGTMPIRQPLCELPVSAQLFLVGWFCGRVGLQVKGKVMIENGGAALRVPLPEPAA